MKKFLLLFAIAMAVVMAGTAAFAGIPAESESVGLVVGHETSAFLVRNEAGKMVTDYYAGTNNPKLFDEYVKALTGYWHFNRALHPEYMKMFNDRSYFNARYEGMRLNTETSGDMTLNFSADTVLVNNSPETQMRIAREVFKQGAHEFIVGETWDSYSIVNEHG